MGHFYVGETYPSFLWITEHIETCCILTELQWNTEVSQLQVCSTTQSAGWKNVTQIPLEDTAMTKPKTQWAGACCLRLLIGVYVRGGLGRNVSV